MTLRVRRVGRLLLLLLLPASRMTMAIAVVRTAAFVRASDALSHHPLSLRFHRASGGRSRTNRLRIPLPRRGPFSLLSLSSFMSSSSSSPSSAGEAGGAFDSNAPSDFATHVLVRHPAPLEELIERVLVERRTTLQTGGGDSCRSVANLPASELIRLGAVWHLPAAVAPTSTPPPSLDAPLTAPFPASELPHPSLGRKPLRVAPSDADAPPLLVHPGDYVRIHHNPRRFPRVRRYDWLPVPRRRSDGASGDDNDDGIEGKGFPGDRQPMSPLIPVTVASDPEAGWAVLEKPERVPVHGTVDNDRENVAACVRDALLLARGRPQHPTNQSADGESNDEVYVSTPQRLDQNTSGLMVIATSRAFARYFASLLRTKTEHQLRRNGGASDGDKDYPPPSRESVHKLYRCLVCVTPPTSCYSNDTDALGTEYQQDDRPWSVERAVEKLRTYAETGEPVRHYLEPSIRMPKRFVRHPPPANDDGGTNDDSSAASWAECLLRVTSVGPVPCALVGSEVGRQLAQALWYALERVPPQAQAVVELEIDLLTGRTHQIRGQMAAMGFPIVGDAPYGGAVPRQSDRYYEADDDEDAHDRLALQCCELEFLNPDLVQHPNGTVAIEPSRRWNRFRLDHAWWTKPLKGYYAATRRSTGSQATMRTSRGAAVESGSQDPEASTTSKPPRPELLPPRVSLSPGRHKYILIQASHPAADDEWFVKSAAPHECGGAYHGNVAQDLRDWIAAAGYKATVTGGGRIYYRPDQNSAVVYGFSYGFGRGDHRRAAALIRDSGIDATVDDSPDLY